MKEISSAMTQLNFPLTNKINKRKFDSVMTQLNFPKSQLDGATYEVNGVTYTYDSSVNSWTGGIDGGGGGALPGIDKFPIDVPGAIIGAKAGDYKSTDCLLISKLQDRGYSYEVTLQENENLYLKWKDTCLEGPHNSTISGTLTHSVNGTAQAESTASYVLKRIPSNPKVYNLIDQNTDTDVVSESYAPIGFGFVGETTWVYGTTNSTDVTLSISNGATEPLPEDESEAIEVLRGNSIQVTQKTSSNSNTPVATILAFTDKKGNTEGRYTFTATTSDEVAAIEQPQITTPAGAPSGLFPSITLESTDYEDGVNGVHESSTWEIYSGMPPLESTYSITSVGNPTMPITAPPNWPLETGVTGQFPGPSGYINHPTGGYFWMWGGSETISVGTGVYNGLNTSQDGKNWYHNGMASSYPRPGGGSNITQQSITGPNRLYGNACSTDTAVINFYSNGPNSNGSYTAAFVYEGGFTEAKLTSTSQIEIRDLPAPNNTWSWINNYGNPQYMPRASHDKVVMRKAFNGPSGDYFVSDDNCKTWSEHTVPMAVMISNNPLYANGHWLWMEMSGSNTVYVASNEGISNNEWKQVNLPEPYASNLNSQEFGAPLLWVSNGERFFIACESGFTAGNQFNLTPQKQTKFSKYMTSVDGFNWTTVTLPKTVNRVSGSNGVFTCPYGMADTNTVIDWVESNYLCSVDGINWTDETSGGGYPTAIGLVHDGHGQFTSGGMIIKDGGGGYGNYGDSVGLTTYVDAAYSKSAILIKDTPADGFVKGMDISSTGGATPAGIADLDDASVTIAGKASQLGFAIGDRITNLGVDFTLRNASINDTTNLTVYDIPDPVLEAGFTYNCRVKYSNGTIESEFSPYKRFKMNDSFLPTPGDAMEGGYYAGQINDNGTIYNLIVAPITSGSLEGQYGGAAKTGVQWKTVSSTGDSGSEVYGKTVTDAKANTSYPVFDWCVNNATGPNAGASSGGTGIGGFNDWYIPASNELEICYYNFRPDSVRDNDTSSGINPNSVPARSTSYTVSDPGVTTVALFQSGGAQAFESSGSFSGGYWTATQSTTNTSGALYQTFESGRQGTNNNKNNSQHARAIRRVAA